MISSPWSRESAPRSSTKEASGVTSLASTPSCSTMMLLTFSSTLIRYPFLLAQKAAVFLPIYSPGASRKASGVRRQAWPFSNGLLRLTPYASRLAILHVETPAHVDDRAGHVGGFVGGQPGH